MKGDQIMIYTNHFNKTIELTKADARNAGKHDSDEYIILTQMMKDFPTYTMVIKSAPKRDIFKGLTMEYMEKFIKAHDESGNVMDEFNILRGKDKDGNSIEMAAVASYGEIKKWFLEKYENVSDFGRNNINKILGKASA